MNFQLTDDEKERLLTLARQTIKCQLHQMALPKPDMVTPTMNEICGAFVTLSINGSLRGCIGNIEGHQALWKTVQAMALAAAFEDPRFPPVTDEEWLEISLEISVLSPIWRGTAEEVKVGTHGIVITRGFNRGLLLPQVATEQGWNRETFLTHGCYKAGLPGNAWEEPETTIELFTALVFGE